MPVGAVSLPQCFDAGLEARLERCLADETDASEFCSRYFSDDAFSRSLECLPDCEDGSVPAGCKAAEPNGKSKTTKYLLWGLAGATVIGIGVWAATRDTKKKR